MSRSLSLDADLTLTHDGEQIGVWSDGDTLVIDAPSYGVLRALARTARTSPLPPAELFAVPSPLGDDGDGNGHDGEDDDGDSGTATEGDTSAAEGPFPAGDAVDAESVLTHHGLTVEVRVRYATVARVGAAADSGGWLGRIASRAVGVPVGVRLRGAVLAAVRRLG